MYIRNISELNKCNFPDHIKQQVIKGFGKEEINNYPSIPVANVEPSFRNESISKNAPPSFNTPVSIHIYSARKAKTDIDNISGKAALDAIVNLGILQDDSPDQIAIYQVHKPKICCEEKTVIVIEEI